MSIVAICETFGSQGNEIGRELGRALGWEVADREIIAKAAERYGEGPTELQHVTDEKPTLWERLTDSRRHYLSYVEATILEMAAQGSVVLVGHGAAIVVRDIGHALRVRITAPEPLRAERVRQQHGLANIDVAVNLVRETDHERASRMKFLYHVDLDDPLLYDVALNTERVNVADSVRLIREALQNASIHPTDTSLARVRDRSLAAQAKARLLAEPRTRGLRLSVAAVGASVTVEGFVESEELRDMALKRVGEVPGIAGVTNQITVTRLPRTYAGA